MNGDKLLTAVGLAHLQHEDAAKRLCEASSAAFPTGAIVVVTLGRARVRGRVTGVSDIWWHDPGQVYIQNVQTGKARNFAPYQDGIDLVIESRPKVTR